MPVPMILLLLCVVILSTWTVQPVQSVAVMSVDFGSEWMKIGIVSPGVPMEIVLNKESKRKTPALVAYRDNVRTFGEDAQTIGIRFPKSSYGYLLDLLAKDINNPIVKLYQQRFPHYELTEDSERGTVLFKHDSNVSYSPEELIAQLLHRAKEFAEQSSLQPVNECVLTVPGFFNQAERKALLQSAELAGLKVLQLINDYTAIALNYGIFRRKDFNETAQYVMFYDMGASKTTATVVSFQITKTKERGYVETNPQLTILGVGYDRTLGGLEIQLRLRDYLATKFNEMKRTTRDVFKDPRAMAKLFKEAGRLKNVLSANPDHSAQVEGLIEEHDFRLQVTREQLEDLCEDLFARVGDPVTQALNTAGLSMDAIGQVILVGAGTRVPKIQDALQALVGMELSKNINTDEAATMGAVYKGADLSTGFKVKKFITRDAVLFPVQVVFERDGKQVRRTLFGLMNPYPQKKIITFNKHTEDFSFNVNYADLGHLPHGEARHVGSHNLSRVSVSGVRAALDKNRGDNIESKGIKAHFAMDDAGVLALTNVEAIFEKIVSAEDEEESPLSKLGSTISKLFTSGEGTPAEEGEPQNKTDGAGNGTDARSNGTASAAPAREDNTKPRIVVVKEPIASEETFLSMNKMSKEQFQRSADKLDALNVVDREQTRRETALNNLETLVIDARVKLDTDEYAQAGSRDEVAKIREMCSRLSDWLYEDGSDADALTYERKISELQTLTDGIYARVWEHRERPEALKALKQMINGSQGFLESAKNLTKVANPEKDVFTDVEIETLRKVIAETIEWRDKLVEDQNKIKKSDPVLLTVKMLSEKMALLDREVKYLVNKIKIWRPKQQQPGEASKEEGKSKDKMEGSTAENKSSDDRATPEPDHPQTEEQAADAQPGAGDDEHSEL